MLSLNTEKDFHQDFQQLLAELNKPDAQYLLTTANRIFGEKTYEFLSVSSINRTVQVVIKMWSVRERPQRTDTYEHDF